MITSDEVDSFLATPTPASKAGLPEFNTGSDLRIQGAPVNTGLGPEAQTQDIAEATPVEKETNLPPIQGPETGLPVAAPEKWGLQLPGKTEPSIVTDNDIDAFLAQGADKDKEDRRQRATSILDHYESNPNMDLPKEWKQALVREAYEGTTPQDSVKSAALGIGKAIISKKTYTEKIPELIGGAAKTVKGAYEEATTPDEGKGVFGNVDKALLSGGAKGGLGLVTMVGDLATAGAAPFVSPEERLKNAEAAIEAKHNAAVAIQDMNNAIGYKAGDKPSSEALAEFGMQMLPFAAGGEAGMAAKLIPKTADALIEQVAPRVAGAVGAAALPAARAGVGVAAASLLPHAFVPVAKAVLGTGGAIGLKGIIQQTAKFIGIAKAAAPDAQSLAEAAVLAKTEPAFNNMMKQLVVEGGDAFSVMKNSVGDEVRRLNKSMAAQAEDFGDKVNVKKLELKEPNGNYTVADSELSPQELKYREMQNKKDFMTKRYNKLDNYDQITNLTKDVAKAGVSTGLTAGAGATVLGGLAATGALPGDVEETAKQGAQAGIALSTPALIPEAASALVISKAGRARAAGDSIAMRGSKVTDPMSTELSTGGQRTVNILNGLVMDNGYKAVAVTPDQLAKITNSKTPPKGVYDPKTKTAYLRSDAVEQYGQSGVAGHELAHVIDQITSNSVTDAYKTIQDGISSPDSKTLGQIQDFLYNYMQAKRRSNPSAMTLSPDALMREGAAELTRYVLAKTPLEELYGGKPIGTTLSRRIGDAVDWLSGKSGESFQIGDFGTPATKKQFRAIQDALYEYGRKVRRGDVGEPTSPLKPATPEAAVAKAPDAAADSALAKKVGQLIQDEGFKIPPEFVAQAIHAAGPNDAPADIVINAFQLSKQGGAVSAHPPAEPAKPAGAPAKAPLQLEGPPSAEEFWKGYKPSEGFYMPETDKGLESVIKDYTDKIGLKYVPHEKYRPLNEEYSKAMADAYAAQQHEPDNPKVKKSYDAFKDVIMGQYNTLVKHGYKIEPWPNEGQPYANSDAMLKDLRENKHVYYFETERGYGEKGDASFSLKHPMLQGSGVFFNGKEALLNDIFRGVHDILGHGHRGFQFGPRGEYNAFLSHASTMPKEALGALANESIGPNSWTNFGAHMRNAKGELIKPGEPGYLTQPKRPFTEQRANFFQFMPEPITKAEARGNSRPVSEDEFHTLSRIGGQKLADLRKQSSPPVGLDKNWDGIKNNAWNESQKDWGGVTIDSHTGEPITKGFSLNARPGKLSGISLPENATKEQFNAAMEQAKQFPELSFKDHSLGVFHDNDKKTIDIDPIVTVPRKGDVQTVGAHTRATGGAYDHSTGNGEFPPHVDPSLPNRIGTRTGAGGVWDSTFVSGEGEEMRQDLAKQLGANADKHFYEQKPAVQKAITEHFKGLDVAQYMPDTRGDAIKEPAFKLEDGRIVSAPVMNHSYIELPKGYYGDLTPGFVTNAGEFLDRRGAYERAASMKQLPARRYDSAMSQIYGDKVAASKQLEGGVFAKTRLDKVAREAQYMPDVSDFHKLAKEKGYEFQGDLDGVLFWKHPTTGKEITAEPWRGRANAIQDFKDKLSGKYEAGQDLSKYSKSQAYGQYGERNRLKREGETQFMPEKDDYRGYIMQTPLHEHISRIGGIDEPRIYVANTKEPSKPFKGTYQHLAPMGKGQENVTFLNPKVIARVQGGVPYLRAMAKEAQAQGHDGLVILSKNAALPADVDQVGLGHYPEAKKAFYMNDKDFAEWAKKNPDKLDWENPRNVYVPLEGPQSRERAGLTEKEAPRQPFRETPTQKFRRQIRETGEPRPEERAGEWWKKEGGTPFEGMQFMPNAHPDAIDKPALKFPDGEIFDDRLQHIKAFSKAFEFYKDKGDKWEKYSNDFIPGWLDKKGNFLTREEALKRATEIKQDVNPRAYERNNGLHSSDFGNQLKFMPSPHPEAIVSAAVKNEKGEIFLGGSHGMAYSKAIGKKLISGYVTRDNQFLDPKQALEHAKRINQTTAQALTDARMKVWGLKGEPSELESRTFNQAQKAQFMPSSHPEAVKAEEPAAIRTPDGKTHTGRSHALAYANMTEKYSADQLGKWSKEHGDMNYFEGNLYQLNNGKIVDEQTAHDNALAHKQMTQADIERMQAQQRRAGVRERPMESMALRAAEKAKEAPPQTFAHQYMPEIPTDEEIVDAVKGPQKAKVGDTRGLSDGTPVGLRIDIPAYNRTGKYVVTVHDGSGAGVGRVLGYDSMAAVDNPTFYSNEAGALKIKEGHAKFPVATVKGEFNPMREFPKDIDSYSKIGYNPKEHSYFYDKEDGRPVIAGDKAISAGNTVYVKNPKYAEKGDFAYMPETEEQAQAAIEQGKDKFPEAYPREYKRDDKGNLIKAKNPFNKKMEAQPIQKPFDLRKSGLYDKVGKEDDFVNQMVHKIVDEHNNIWSKDPNTMAAKGWYDVYKLLKEKGLNHEQSTRFIDLLSATSGRQRAGAQFNDALEAHNRMEAGDYDEILKNYKGALAKFEKGELVDDKGEKITKPSQFSSYIYSKDWLPRKTTGAKFGMHSYKVLKTLAGQFAEVTKGLKYIDFANAMHGLTTNPVIDIWSYRSLDRMANEGYKDVWRRLPENEPAVNDPDYLLSRQIMTNAAKKLGYDNPTDLQAINWFGEKKLWFDRGWARDLDLSDYRPLIHRMEPRQGTKGMQFNLKTAPPKAPRQTFKQKSKVKQAPEQPFQ